MARKISGGYMAHAYDTPAEMAEQYHAVVGTRRRVDTLVGTGLSGALVVPILARELGKDWLIIRKKGDGSHAGTIAEGHLGARWIFVDDFIATGTTQRRVVEALERLAKTTRHETKYVGAYLYAPMPTFTTLRHP